jgi:hypothetical protein
MDPQSRLAVSVITVQLLADCKSWCGLMKKARPLKPWEARGRVKVRMNLIQGVKFLSDERKNESGAGFAAAET